MHLGSCQSADLNQPAIGPMRSQPGFRVTGIAIGFAAAAAIFAGVARAQQEPPPRPPHPILLPEANHLPDVNDQMVMKEQNAKKKDFSAANAERKRQIDDEAVKLLILAKDLKAKMEKAGNDPLSPTLVREAEVIELLAGDLKLKMKMTVGGS